MRDRKDNPVNWITPGGGLMDNAIAIALHGIELVGDSVEVVGDKVSFGSFGQEESADKCGHFAGPWLRIGVVDGEEELHRVVGSVLEIVEWVGDWQWMVLGYS